MRDFEHISATQLLSIKEPEALFTNSSSEAKLEYRRLVRYWHPDTKKTPESERVFLHIVQLYNRAVEKISSGNWDTLYAEQSDGLYKFKLLDGEVKSCRYRSKFAFELGTTYVADNSMMFEVAKNFEDLFENGHKRIHTLTFKNNAMALEFANFLPQVKELYKTTKANLLVVRKTPDQLLLSDIIDYAGGTITPITHIGWILNSLLNIACYLQWTGLTHNAICAKTVVISPLRHSVMLLGGWFYCTEHGRRLRYLPDETVTHAPPDVLNTKNADFRVDLESIKALGRAIAGDVNGSKLRFDKSYPQDLAEWLTMPAGDDAREEYKIFKHEVLRNSFGPPRFINWKLDAQTLYKKES